MGEFLRQRKTERGKRERSFLENKYLSRRNFYQNKIYMRRRGNMCDEKDEKLYVMSAFIDRIIIISYAFIGISSNRWGWNVYLACFNECQDYCRMAIFKWKSPWGNGFWCIDRNACIRYCIRYCNRGKRYWVYRIP